jgi:beta-lactam-binding protein with PASTA domain
MIRQRSSTALAVTLTAVVLCTIAHAANHGVFIGTAKYTAPGCAPLPDTRFDANDMANTMIREGMVPQDKAKVVAGKNTKAQVLQAIANQSKNMGPNDTLYIYNSGHGGSGGKLWASDASITGAEMSAVIAKSGCGKVVLVNDSCHSGAFKLKVPGKKIAQVNAAAADKVAYSSTTPLPQMGHNNGAMTKYVIEGLTNGAADVNGDGQVSAKEIAAWSAVGVRNSEQGGQSHGYLNTTATQNPNFSGDDVTMTAATPNKAFIGQRLVPNVTGDTVDTAQSKLRKDGLTSIRRVSSMPKKDWIPASWAGCVERQVPVAGMRVAPGASIDLYIIHPMTTTVPNVIGKKLPEARAALIGAGLMVYVDNPTDTGDYVGFQYPLTGAKIVSGSWVSISKGKMGEVAVPFIEGVSREEAGRLLKASGLKGNFRILKPTNIKTHPPFQWAGKVWISNPSEGSSVATGDTVKVSIAPDTAVDVPYLKTMSLAEAKAALAKVGLVMKVTMWGRRITLHDPEGVYTWRPQPQAFKGDTVRVGVELPEVPSLVGKSEQVARKLCAAARLRFATVKKPLPPTAKQGLVAEQSPKAGTWAVRGDLVTATLPLEASGVTLKVVDDTGAPKTDFNPEEAFAIKARPTAPNIIVGDVRWTLIFPDGRTIPSKKKRSGLTGLTLKLKASANNWPTGKYMARLSADSDQGELKGAATFTILPPAAIAFTLAKPWLTGQWAKVKKIEALPFKVGGDIQNVRIEGAGAYADRKYWKLEGKSISFRPTKPGKQTPTFTFVYGKESAPCQTSLDVTLTTLPVVPGEPPKDPKQPTPFTFDLPDTFVPPVTISITPSSAARITGPPKKEGKVWRFSGTIMPKAFAGKLTRILFDLTDSTDAVARAVLEKPGNCPCQNPPPNILAALKLMHDKKAQTAEAKALYKKQNWKGGNNWRKRNLRAWALIHEWQGKLTKCNHISDKFRSYCTRMGVFLRQTATKRGPPAGKGKALRAFFYTMGPDDVKAGYMQGVMYGQ